jgi:hypothetical protein
MQGDRKSLVFNISSVANQRMPTSAALILRKVESLLLAIKAAAVLELIKLTILCQPTITHAFVTSLSQPLLNPAFQFAE